MSKQNGNMTIKIFRSIFVAVNLALISGGLVSCGFNAPQPLAPTEQQRPVVQPNHNDEDDDDNDGDRRNNDRQDDDDDDDND